MADFIWGAGGARMTPEEIAQQRKVATSLMASGMDYSPIASPWQGASRVAQALLGGLESGQADAASRSNATESAALISSMIGGGATSTAPVASSAGATAPVASSGSPPGADAIREGLIKRGVPVPVADGFIMNFRDESGFNPGLNEAKPLVPGSRGGFGLAQWTGPRRVALEQFAQQSGRPVGDVDTQLDFLMSELNGAEAGSAQSFMSAKTPQEAAVAIARNFLRPSTENLNRRVASYSGGSDPAALPANSQPTQGGYVIQGQAQTTARPSIHPAILELVSSPYVSPEDRKIGALLFQNQLESQQKANDPLRQMQIEEARTKLTPLGAPTVDAQGNLVQTDPLGKVTVLKPSANAPSAVQEYNFYADQESKAGRQPMPFGQWDISRKKAGATSVPIQVGAQAPDGELRKKLDEGTAKNWTAWQEAGHVSAGQVQDLQMLDELIKVAPQGPLTGRLAEMFPGVSSAGDAFNAIVKRVAPTMRAPGSGSTSDIEYDGMLRSLPALRNNPEANVAISEMMKAKSALNIERADIISQYSQNQISRNDAEKRLSELNRRSIMTPAMRQMLTGLGGKGDVPLVGDIVDGHRFKGGDPANQASWEKVQ